MLNPSPKTARCSVGRLPVTVYLLKFVLREPGKAQLDLSFFLLDITHVMLLWLRLYSYSQLLKYRCHLYHFLTLGFSGDQFSQNNDPMKGDKVYLKSATGMEYECRIHKDGCTKKQIQCYTPAR